MRGCPRKENRYPGPRLLGAKHSQGKHGCDAAPGSWGRLRETRVEMLDSCWWFHGRSPLPTLGGVPPVLGQRWC